MRITSWLNHKSSAVFAVVTIAFALGLIASGQSPKQEVASDTTKNRGLIERVGALEADQRAHASILSSLSQTSPPVGSVIAFAGNWPPVKSDGSKWTEEELGWMLCDGRNLEGSTYTDLRTALGNSALPDYRGYFLRGIDVSIDGKTTSGRDKDGIRLVGAAQSDAFKAHGHELNDQGHSHTMGPFGGDKGKNGYGAGDERSAWAWYGQQDRKTTSDKTGISVKENGDKETRPINMAVYWIIKSGAPNLRHQPETK